MNRKTFDDIMGRIRRDVEELPIAKQRPVDAETVCELVDFAWFLGEKADSDDDDDGKTDVNFDDDDDFMDEFDELTETVSNLSLEMEAIKRHLGIVVTVWPLAKDNHGSFGSFGSFGLN